MGRVALIGENSIGYIKALINIWNNGDCAVLLDWRIPSSTLLEMMVEAGAQKCFIEEKLLCRLNAELSVLESIEYIPYEKLNSSAELLPNYIYDEFHDNYSCDEAVVIYSSGTTGKSKGVILSHYAINTNADSIIDYIKPTPEDCIYMAKTISHASSLVGELLVALKSRTTIVIAPVIVPPRYTMANISKYNVTIMCINPTLLQMYIEEYTKRNSGYDISSLKQVYVHGAKTNIRCCEMAAQVFPSCSIYYEYGLTEAGPRVATQKICARSIDSVGMPLRDVHVKIINQDKKEAAENENGLIHVKTPSIYLGYVCGNSKFETFEPGWLNTGDIGYFDKFGELHIVGRADDVIIIHAHKIYPSEIERVILECSAVKECAVAKVEINGNDCIGCLYAGDKEISGEINGQLKNRLLPYEIPRFFMRCDKLPRTKNGKIIVAEVRDILKKK